MRKKGKIISFRKIRKMRWERDFDSLCKFKISGSLKRSWEVRKLRELITKNLIENGLPSDSQYIIQFNRDRGDIVIGIFRGDQILDSLRLNNRVDYDLESNYYWEILGLLENAGLMEFG